MYILGDLKKRNWPHKIITLSVKLSLKIFTTLEVVSRYHDPQFEVGEKSS